MMTGQVVFLFSGFLINSGLARILKPVDYGTFGLVMSILVIVELFVITGIPEAIQKYGGERPQAMAKLISKTLPWQMVYAFCLFGVFWLAAPVLARTFGHSELTFFLRIASVDIVIYGLYKYYLGVQNGLHRFVQYTILGIIYSLSKLAAIFGLVWLGFSIAGALVGNMLGSLMALVLALFFSRVKKTDAGLEDIPLVAFVAQNVLYFVGLNLFFSLDLWFVKYYLPGKSVGLYVSAGVLAKLTYLISVALSAVLLPSIARSIKIKDDKRTRELIQDSLRYLVIFLVLVNIVITTNSAGIVQLFFGAEYLDAAPILSILAVALSLLTLMAVINTMMIANEQMRASLVMILSLIALDAVLNRILVPRFGLQGAALATSAVGVLGAIWGGLYVFDEFKTVLFSKSGLRLTGITLLILVLSKWLVPVGIDFFIKTGLTGGVYLALLWLTKEINPVDLRRLKESIGLSKT